MTNFTDINELKTFIHDKGKNCIPISYQLLPKYPGVVLYIGMIYEPKKENYELSLEWMAMGLDFYGDTIQESYIYAFHTLEALLEYLSSNYKIEITDIPLKFEFDSSQFPNPINDAHEKLIFEAAWNQFEEDFRKRIFLDHSLLLVYSSNTT